MNSAHYHQCCHDDDQDDQDDPHDGDVQARFASSEESSACSSVLSSLESVESNTSEGRNDVTYIVLKGVLLHNTFFFIA